MDKLEKFQGNAVVYGETQQVKAGVECDTYRFVGDDTRDLAIVRVDKGSKTRLQRILLGNKTIEAYVSGEGTLAITEPNGETRTLEFPSDDRVEVEVNVGQLMQWTGSQEQGVTFYEICDPPYEDGRFEDLD
jgi:hypothetical protein